MMKSRLRLRAWMISTPANSRLPIDHVRQTSDNELCNRFAETQPSIPTLNRSAKNENNRSHSQPNL
jgi:hypothetical protein